LAATRRFVQESVAILFRVVLAFVLALTGGLISVMVGVSHQRLCALISLAAGTLLGVTVCTILPESWAVLPWWQVVLAVGSGYAVFSLISRYVYHVCPACAASHFDEATTHRFSEIATALIIALGIHSTMDGIAVAAGHEAGRLSDASVLLAVCVHKLPEGLALGALLLGAGFNRPATVGWVAAVESTTLLGGVIGMGLVRAGWTTWLAPVLAHVGGGFVFLAVHAVFGELVKHGKIVVLANFAGGVVLIAVLKLAVWLL
jgi:ZIP family zinc transporter